MRRTLSLIAAIAALALGACTSVGSSVDRARARNDTALQDHDGFKEVQRAGSAMSLIQYAYVAAADGRTRGADSLEEAAEFEPRAAHRYLFRDGNAGDRAYRLAYIPETGLVAGRALAEALGLRLRRGAENRVVVSRDIRRVTADADARVEVHLESLDGRAALALMVTFDPDFDGPLLVPMAVAEELALWRFETPGVASIAVALGRPRRARRASLRAIVPALEATGVVEALYPLISSPTK